MSQWKECKLGDVCDVRDGTHDSPKQNNFGKPLVTSKNLKNGSIDLDNTYLISEFDFAQINKRSKVDRFDILFSMIGTVGEMAIVKEEPDFAIKNVGLFKCRNNFDLSKWIYYYMKSNAAEEEIQAAKKGSTQSYIALGDLRNFPILLPPLSEQKAIAGVLSSLDDKIDNLHRQNKTLEAMAETLFRQWFVEEADESWEVKTISDVVTVVSGTTPKTENPEFWNGEYHWTSPRDITNLNGIYLFDTERKITQKGLDQIGSGLLPEGSLLMSSRAPVGALAFAEIPVAINQGYAGIVCDKGFSREFIYLWLKANMDYVQSHANGSTFQEISKGTFKTLNIQIGNPEYMDKFQYLVESLFKKIKLSSIQIRTLEKLRDTLLPKLMSGEVRVSQ